MAPGSDGRPGPRIRIGTSGWSYNHWHGAFYPKEMPSSQWLAHYIQFFNSVEINGSFYGLPTEHTLIHWRASVPDDFVFSMKASRYITHMKKLNQPERGLEQFIARARLLGDKLGPILFQLPPHWRLNLERLALFLKMLSKEHRYAMELRDPTWWEPTVYALLAEHDVAHCIFDLNGRLSPLEVTTDFAYVRLHGPGSPYQGQYGNDVLARWAQTFRDWQREGRAVYCYFDNDQAGYAARDAQRLQAATIGQ